MSCAAWVKSVSAAISQHGPAYVKPELCATAPNQVYAWDITKLHGQQKWTYFYLYAVIDIYSRYVVGWMIADRTSSTLAKLASA